MMKLSHFIVAIMLMLSLVSFAAAETCKIDVEGKLHSDFDCDGIVDQSDNCPYVANSEQADSNNNQIGDTCDLVIQGIDVRNKDSDESIKPGEEAVVTVHMLNRGKQPLAEVYIVSDIKSLQLKDSERSLRFDPDELAPVQFVLPIPENTKVGRYTVDIAVTYGTDSILATAPVFIGVEPGFELPEGVTLGETKVFIQNIQDVELNGKAAIYPVKITNYADNPRQYELTVSNINEWGSYKVDPDDRVVIQPGETETVYVSVYADNQAKLGERTFYLTIDSGDQSTRVKLIAQVVNPVRSDKSDLRKGLELAIILFVIILIILGMVIGMKKLQEDKEDEIITNMEESDEGDVIYRK